ncbi:gamma-glutamylcyclotransferase isoform X2 [Eupeodes corollae]|uniref:gamma-glutamylcyclotransferase isoform X2 n=1 Tax=Eupeodes corollae TaxID=290404 RepID=UPI0024929628|nr:gamma-glutamylcyclotransferase isoform X2 [Eupeodes corollae]
MKIQSSLICIVSFVCAFVQSSPLEKTNEILSSSDKVKNVVETMELPEVDGDHFNYFGYGSNLLAARIHIENESAVRKAVGKLKDYRLDFNTYTKRWNGAPATIVPTNNSVVYGAIWSIDLKDLPDLDRQEGVHSNIYFNISVPVETANGTIMCRAYLLTQQPTTILHEGEEVPFERQPSKTYLKTLVKGAIETGIPETYLNWMKKIKHNGNLVDSFEKQLELESVELSS